MKGKRIIALLMSLALAGSLIACAPKDSQDTANGDGTQNEQSANNGSGNNQGGNNQGGNNQGGNNQGGNNQGGNNQGGDNQGGNNQGGNNQGGDNQGGDNQGGDNQGGDNQGGDNQGGDNQGGDNQGGGTDTPTPLPAVSYPSNPNFGWDVSVHDPSVFQDDDGTFYAFGSHFAIASSTDLIHWTQRTRDFGADELANAKTKLYGTENFRSVLSQSDELVHGDQNTWAPDVVKIGDKYYMYYSLTSGFGSNESVIGRVEWDKNLAHFTNEEILVYSKGNNAPNAIDPELFYDKEGKLWMVYGSFFAGIYIRELETEGARVGLPKNDDIRDYGTLLWKGSGSGVEGPFIFYSEETDYYYLMVSDGSLRNADDARSHPGEGNYNMRVVRSRTPDGDYEDITGARVADEYGHGNKLAGNYQFTGDTGYGAQGHNSVIKVGEKYFVVSHIRTRESGDRVSLGHSLRVNQLFFNEDGWPVLAPNRYAGETLGKVTAEQIAGNYDILLHTEGNSFSFAASTAYTLTADGKIKSGSLPSGSWSLSVDYNITLNFEGRVYKGVVAPAWCSYRNKAVLSITATSAEGRALWANGGAAAPNGFTLTDSSTVIYDFHRGTVADVSVAAFDTTNGFSVSFWLDSATSDWHSPVVTAGNLWVHLPNIDAYNASGTLAGMNRYPVDWRNGANYRVFLDYQTCFVTITITSEGVTYYKNGSVVAVIHAADKMIKDNAETSTEVRVFLDELLADIAENGFTFASTADVNGQIIAKNMFLTNALGDTQAQTLYTDYFRLG